jgi:hypothetical protein
MLIVLLTRQIADIYYVIDYQFLIANSQTYID